MAQVTTRVITESDSYVTLLVNLSSDGTGELENEVLFTPAEASPPMLPRPAFRIWQVWYQMVWFDVELTFAGIEPQPALTLARDTENYMDLRQFGGLIDTVDNPPLDKNGNLLISTNGFVLGSKGTLVLQLRKRDQ